MTMAFMSRFARRLALVAIVSGMAAAPASAETAAKQLFGRVKLPTVDAPDSHGFYSKGCIDGAVAMPVDGPTWQAMRLERNRRWGHPKMIELLQRLSREAVQDGWPGLLVGDISQPRGGPMLSGHASHQMGLDADIWLNPMPNRTLTVREREDISAVSMLKGDTLYVDPNRWTDAHARLIVRAASYPEVERIFVHPGIKKKLCDTWKGDRSAFNKIRPYWGHHYHFHIRMSCPKGARDCKSQAAPPAGDGCDKSLAWWFTDEPWKPAKPAKPGEKPKPKREMRLSELPAACARVIDAPSPSSEAAVTFEPGMAVMRASASTVLPSANIPVPTPRPVN